MQDPNEKEGTEETVATPETNQDTATEQGSDDAVKEAENAE